MSKSTHTTAVPPISSKGFFGSDVENIYGNVCLCKSVMRHFYGLIRQLHQTVQWKRKIRSRY